MKNKMWLPKFLTFAAVVANNVCDGYKLLVVFPVPGKSHSILGEGYVRHLMAAGHEVTYITPILIKNPAPNLRQIDLLSLLEVSNLEEVMSVDKILRREIDLVDITSVMELMHGMASSALMHENVQKFLHDPREEFDAVIVEWLYSELYSGFAQVFNCPLIWSSSMEPHHLVLSLIDEDPNPAYAADILNGDVPPFTFYQRVGKLWAFLHYKFVKWYRSGIDTEAYNTAFESAVAKRGRSLVPLHVAKYNASLMLGNSHVSVGQALKLPQSYKSIAGYHIEKAPPLPQDLQRVMDESKHGVIYFSLGSMLRSSSLPDHLKRGFVEVLGTFNQTVIWKFEEKLKDLPKNVHILKWAPQRSILAHKNCLLFISHGGLLSTTEALHYGVPIIGMPMFGDQFANVNRAIMKGIAKRVDLDYDTPINLKAAIHEMLHNQGYRDKLQELSLVYHDRPVSPGEELVHWVEHVVRTRGAPHLRSTALDMPWYEIMYLDLAIVIMATLFIVVYIVRKLMALQINVDVKKKYI